MRRVRGEGREGYAMAVHRMVRNRVPIFNRPAVLPLTTGTGFLVRGNGRTRSRDRPRGRSGARCSGFDASSGSPGKWGTSPFVAALRALEGQAAQVA
ncbi:MAG: hypothetical protein AAF514_23205, partial [Verrucomicrobiota bacterium]